MSTRNISFRLDDKGRDDLETVRIALQTSGHYLHPVTASDALRWALGHAATSTSKKAWKP